MPSEYWDRLSDIEIQQKLIQFGYPHCPVTETTRAVLIKKLQKHTRKEELKKGKIPNYVLHYNGDSKPNTDAIPAPPTNSIERRPNLHENGLRNNKIDVCRNHQPSVYRKGDADVNPSLMAASRMYVPPPLLASDYENENDGHNMNAARKSYRKPLPYAADNSSSYIKLQHGKSNACDGGVVNRLLSFRDTSIQKKSISKDGYAVHPSRSLIIKNGIVQKFLTFDVKSFFKKPDVSQFIIPHVLMAILVIFLSLISVLYMAKKFDLSPITETDIKYTICNGNDVDFRGSSSSSSQPTIKCINEDLYNKAVYISKELFKYLNERARLHHCISADHSAALDMNEFKKALLSGNSNLQQNGNLHTKLLATQYLIAQNPQWMIKMITTTHNSSEQILSFELIEPSLPLKCVIRKKIKRFFTVLGLLLLVASGCLAIYFLIVVYRLKQKESLLAIEQFTMDIINELIYRSTHTESSEVLINQLQEKFLPAHNRKKLLRPWNKALKNLEANDNILFGIVARNGEQLRTMTWNKNIANNEPSSTTATTKKKWQSSAFDNSNKIHNPPTSCLKIRHMFDPSEINDPNLRQLMIDSILEKVGSHCNICDVQLDTQSCCVYIRCASEADAGIVHNEINGWWFDKRLISIKFLRIERYLNRFPKSLSESLYLKSSNVN